MSRSMITAATTMNQIQKKLDTIGHNLANVDTNGYKRREARFGELLTQQMNNQLREDAEVGRRTPNGIRQTVGAKIGETSLRLDQGSIKQTDRPLDIAILNKSDFLQVNVEENGVEETHFTRDGVLYLSPIEDGGSLLVTSEGYPILGEDGPITVAADIQDIRINRNGEIIATDEEGIEGPIGQLELVRIMRPQLLLASGNNEFRLPDLEELNLVEEDILTLLEQEQVNLQTGALESSNVDVAKEMTEMMLAQRSYQFNAKSISTSDQMMGLVNNLR